MKKKLAVGMMSGTSMDGIDIAFLETDGQNHVVSLEEAFYPYGADVREQLEKSLETATNITERNQRPGNLVQIEEMITHLHGESLSMFLRGHDLQAAGIDVIGFHGQTVLHRPQDGLTVQLGDGQRLAEMTGIDVVHDMRAADMREGGQGAPLVPVYHQALAKRLSPELTGGKPVCFVNIGGISNITYVGENDLVAFDSGPGNALIDQWVHAHAGIPYDQNAMIAAEGEVLPALVERYMADSFFEKPVPKSLDRNDFLPPEPEAATLEEGARSLARVTAEAIMRSVEHLPENPGLWIICGGGRLNPVIMADLDELAKARGSRVIAAEEADLKGDVMEAEAWAYLAVRSLYGLPLTYPTTTGCRTPVTGGILARAAKSN